jgi:uncharacterized repeat protein (TIGR02059 family)
MEKNKKENTYKNYLLNSTKLCAIFFYVGFLFLGFATQVSAAPAPPVTHISSAGVTGFVVPETGGTPQVFGALTAGSTSYSVMGLSWSPTDNPFDAITAYTATVVLTSTAGYKFPVEGIAVPTANGGGIVSAGTTSGGDVMGNTLTFTVLFPATTAVPPTFLSAVTNTAGTIVTVAFSKAMADPSGKHAQFTVLVNGSANTVTAVALNADTTKIDLTLTTGVLNGQTVTVAYTQGDITSLDTGTLASFTAQSVTNNGPTTISATAIAGVTAPITEATPITTVTAGTDYTGTVSWNTNPTTFAQSTIYTATITLSPTTGYTLQGVTTNQFTIAGSTSAVNSADVGTITVIFPATEATVIAVVETPITGGGNANQVFFNNPVQQTLQLQTQIQEQKQILIADLKIKLIDLIRQLIILLQEQMKNSL